MVLIGPSASGKTMWAAEQFAPDVTVSSDRLRAAVRRRTPVIDPLGTDAERRRMSEVVVRLANLTDAAALEPLAQ